MPRLRVIGIGVGDPGHVTVQAVEALREVDVFFVLDKSGPAHDLTLARAAILSRFVPDGSYRTVIVSDPERDRRAPDYADAVRRWREARVDRLAEAVATELAGGGVGGFLVWGDPSLYDGTIRIVDDLAARQELDIDYDVVAGVSSIHALTAAHRIPLNRVAGAVQVTTGRRLADHWPADADDVVVMLDADLACRGYPDADIYWGAYLGLPDQILRSGRVGDVVDDIAAVRAQARERRGWMMDSYLLRRTGETRPAPGTVGAAPTPSTP